MTATSPASDVAEVLRHHATDRLVQVWRNPDEKQRNAAIETALAAQDFGRITGIFMGFAALCIGGVTAVGVLLGAKDEGNPVPMAVIAGVAIAAAIATFVHFARRTAKTAPRLAEVAPFHTTPAGAWAYAAAWSYATTRDRAEQCRAALEGRSLSDQVGAPEHDELLRLGLTASA